MTKDMAQVVYLQWLAKNHPELYTGVAARSLKTNLNGLGWIAALVNAVIQVGSAVVQKKQADKALKIQKQTVAAEAAQADKERAAQLQMALLDINTKRAQSGLPPVDANGAVIQGAALPMPASLAPYASAVKDSAPWLILGAVAIGAFFILKR